MIKKISAKSAIAVLTIISLFTFSFSYKSNVASAAVSNWQKGFSIQPNSSTDFSSDSFKLALKNAHAVGANYVSLIIPYAQSQYSTTIDHASNTPTDDSLVAAITYAHSLGMQVMLKPHVDAYGTWRANIDPSDRTTWFSNYSAIINHYIDIAIQNNVEEFSIGAELISMSTETSHADNTQRWVNLIQSIRARGYSGKLTYSANWGGSYFADEKDHIAFWPYLDFIGISAYFDLNTDSSVNSLQQAWDGWNNNEIRPLSQKYNKPILFSEIGYRSVTNAHTQPWNSGMGGSYDAQEQSNDFSALFSYWNNYPYMQGVQIWMWSTDPNYGGQGNTDYTPYSKPAQDIITTWFGNSAPTPNPTPSQPPAFTASSKSTPAQPKNTDPIMLDNNFTNTGGVINNTMVDVEVYNSAGTRIQQNYFANQGFGQGQTLDFQTQLSTLSPDTYSVRVGIFNNNWTQNYYWNNNAGQFTVTTGASTPPPPPPTPTPTPTPTGQHTVDIWWPSDGSKVTGVQPFKAMTENISASQYTMYWQVDGDQLNLMNDSTQDYPHKESLVDVSGWKWKGSGPYNINFVAKDSAGNVLGQKAVNIYTY